jgi:sortase A
VKKCLKNLERLLLVVGFGLLAFCAAAKIEQILLSRAAIQQLEHRKQPAVNLRTDRAVTPPASKPDFLLWSKERIRHYEDSLGQHFAPPLAVLRIPRVRVEAPVLEGTDDLTLNRGVGRIEGTAHFGENGNVGIAGHRDGFFRGLKDIKLGDRIDLQEPHGIETYVVDKLEVVDPANVAVLRSNSTPALTLVTCYPFYYIGSAPQRYIVHAKRVDTEPPGFGTELISQRSATGK